MNLLDQSVIIRTIGEVLVILISIIEILLFVRAMLSWFPGANENKFGDIVHQLTEPVIVPFRRLISRSSIANVSMIDLAFIVTFLMLEILKGIIRGAL